MTAKCRCNAGRALRIPVNLVLYVMVPWDHDIEAMDVQIEFSQTEMGGGKKPWGGAEKGNKTWRW